MTVFEEMFMESKGKPFRYEGKTLRLLHDFPVHGATGLCVTIETTCSQWRQGVGLRSDTSFVINGSDCGSKIVLWEHTAPSSIKIELSAPCRSIEVRNVWDTGDGVIHSLHNGAAMWVEETPNGFRYHCNDGEADDDFDDIVFRIELIPA